MPVRILLCLLVAALLAVAGGCGDDEVSQIWGGSVSGAHDEERERLGRLERRLTDAGFDVRLEDVNAYRLSEGSVKPPDKAVIPALIVSDGRAQTWVHARGERWDPVLGKFVVEVACGDGLVTMGRSRSLVEAVGRRVCG